MARGEMRHVEEEKGKGKKNTYLVETLGRDQETWQTRAPCRHAVLKGCQHVYGHAIGIIGD